LYNKFFNAGVCNLLKGGVTVKIRKKQAAGGRGQGIISIQSNETYK
jgi:hypothetical protein